MNRSFHRITDIGLVNGLSTMDRQRVVLLNSFVLLAQVLSIILLVVNLALGTQATVPLMLGGMIFLMLPVYILQHYQRYLSARVFFFIILFCLSIPSILSTLYQANRSAGPEIIYFGFGIVVLFLFDGRTRRLFFMVCVGVLEGLECIKVLDVLQQDIVALIYSYINHGVVWLLIWVVISIYRQEKDRSLLYSERLREELSAKSAELALQNRVLKETSAELDQQRGLLNTVIDHQPLLLVVFDHTGRCLFANPWVETYLKIPLPSLPGKTLRAITNAELYNLLWPHLEKALQGERRHFEAQCMFPDLEKRYINGEFVHISEGQGQHSVVVMFLQDITPQKEHEQALLEINDQKDRIFSLVSQELKQPIRMMTEILDFNGEAHLSQYEFQEYTQRVKNQLGKMALTLENLLYWSQAQQNSIIPKPQPLELLARVQECAVLYQEVASERGIEFDLDIDRDLLVYMEIQHLRLALLNVIDNAIRFAKPDTVVSFRAWQDRQKVYLSITDNGVGMSSEYLEALERRLDDPLNYEATEGVAPQLGLRLTAHVFSLNGAEFRVESQEYIGTNTMMIWPSSMHS